MTIQEERKREGMEMGRGNEPKGWERMTMGNYSLMNLWEEEKECDDVIGKWPKILIKPHRQRRHSRLW